MDPIINTFASEFGDITYITLCNSSGANVTLSSLGAGIVSINVPDSTGILDDVALGYAEAESYFNDGPTMGKIPGRYANRIKFGKFRLDNTDYQLPINLPPHTLHGGFEAGIHNKIWDIDTCSGDTVTFRLVSPDGDAGFPGELKLKATYHWSEYNSLALNIEAETDKPTIVNFTSHAYLNLKGLKGGTALDHILQLNCDFFLETDSTLVPTGRLLKVEGTPMDFREPKAVGRDMAEGYEPLRFAKGYDHCFVINNYCIGKVRSLGKIYEPSTGRIVEILTDQPAAQLYTATWMDGAPAGKSGYIYQDYDGIAIEPQDYPDAPNNPGFPSTRLNPGERYSRNIIFRFITR